MLLNTNLHFSNFMQIERQSCILINNKQGTQTKNHPSEVSYHIF